MSLYYELDPADDNDPPLLPPILTPVVVPDKIDVFNKAIAAAGNSEAGTVFYSESTEFVELAVVLNPEVKKYSGNMLYIDHRPAITRSSNQKEDIKVILQF